MNRNRFIQILRASQKQAKTEFSYSVRSLCVMIWGLVIKIKCLSYLLLIRPKAFARIDLISPISLRHFTAFRLPLPNPTPANTILVGWDFLRFLLFPNFQSNFFCASVQIYSTLSSTFTELLILIKFSFTEETIISCYLIYLCTQLLCLNLRLASSRMRHESLLLACVIGPFWVPPCFWHSSFPSVTWGTLVL